VKEKIRRAPSAFDHNRNSTVAYSLFTIFPFRHKAAFQRCAIGCL